MGASSSGSVKGPRRLALIVTCVAIFAAGGALYWYWPQSAAPSAPRAAARAPVPVSIAVATPRDLPVYLTGLGTVQASLTVRIHSQIDGTLQTVHFTEGQHVKKGDVLAKIDPRLFQAALDQAKAKKAQDEAQLIGAEKDLARAKALAQRDFGSQQTVDQQQAKVDQFKASIAADEAAIATAQTQFDYTSITAPNDGRIGIRLVDPGNLVRASDPGGIASLVLLQPSAVVFTLPSRVLALTVHMAIQIPKGFFPIQDTGMILGLAEAAQETSPAEMIRLQLALGEVVMRDPDIQSINAATGSTDSPTTANTSRFIIVLKPYDQRKATASQIIDRLRPQFARFQGANVFMQVPQDINVGGRVGRGTFQYTLQAVSVAELIEWSQKMLEKMRTLPELADPSSDLLANAPQLNITINRDQASRFGISPQLIDDTLNDAYGQRQVTQYLTQLNANAIILEILPDLQGTLGSLDRIYIKSPLTGGAVPLSALVDIDSNKVGPLSVTHQGQFPSVTLGFNLRAGVALGQAVDAINQAARDLGMPGSVIATFQGNAQAFQTSLSSMPVLILAALIVVYMILGVLYESFIHPLTILSTPPSAGIGALLALQVGHMDLSVIGIIGIILLIGIVKKNGIMLVDFAITAERDHGMAPLAAIREACLLRFRPILMTTAAAMLAGVPLALGSGTGSEMRQPLGYAMVGGLALSQLLTLYTTPVVYLYLDRLQNWLRRNVRPRGREAEEVPAVAAE